MGGKDTVLDFFDFWRKTWNDEDERKNFYVDDDPQSTNGWKSWDYCYASFQEARGKSNVDYDSLCLHLTAYLASWGMYRGSSFQSKFNYKIHKDAVRIVLEEKYKCLDGIALRDLNDEKVGLIGELYGRIEKAYGDNTPTDTLVTKIMLGTTACLPAYDTYFKRALGALNIKNNLAVRPENRIKAIKEFAAFCAGSNVLENDDIMPVTEYYKEKGHPDMKILDLYFVTWGQPA